MFKILGELYYIDFEELDAFLILDENYEEGITESIEITKNFDATAKITSSSEKTIRNHKMKEINGVRYDIIRAFIEDINGDGMHPPRLPTRP